MKPKQTIVVRHDLKMRKGKIAAQVAHAAMKPLLEMMQRSEVNLAPDLKVVIRTLQLAVDGPVNEWLDGKFTKICAYVTSEEELDELYEKAKAKNIPCAMIIDEGLTEFHGEKTKTCIAVGPWDPEDIDQITGHLPLL